MAWSKFVIPGKLYVRFNEKRLDGSLKSPDCATGMRSNSSAFSGGAGRVVVVDETFFIKKKKNKGDLAGRSTQGSKTLVMGFLELDLQTRRATGACGITIPNCKKQTSTRKSQGTLSWLLIFSQTLQILPSFPVETAPTSTVL